MTTFIIYLAVVFVYSAYSAPNRYSEDLDVLKKGRFWTGAGYDYDNDGVVDEIVYSHPYPILGIVIFKYVPRAFFLWIGPFALVFSYLLLYSLVSRKIIYLYPITAFNVLFFYTFTTRSFDWLLLPVVYDRLNKNRDLQGVIVGALLVYIHGFISFAYLVVLFGYMRRFKGLLLVMLLALPQLLPLIYFTRRYYGFWSNVTAISWSVEILSHPIVLNIDNFTFRALLALSYLIPFMILVREEQSRPVQ